MTVGCGIEIDFQNAIENNQLSLPTPRWLPGGVEKPYPQKNVTTERRVWECSKHSQ